MTKTPTADADRAATRLRERFDAKFGDMAEVMSSLNAWRFLYERWRSLGAPKAESSLWAIIASQHAERLEQQAYRAQRDNASRGALACL